MSGWRSRFVDRRTSVLMRRLRENAMLEAEITADRRRHWSRASMSAACTASSSRRIRRPTAPRRKALRNAAQKALASEIEERAERFSAPADDAFVLANDGTMRWTGEPVGQARSRATSCSSRACASSPTSS